MATLPAIPPLKIEELTTKEIDGKGVFDVLMRAFQVHIEQEFSENRIKGPEYSQVYLGGLQSVMATALEFLTRGRKDALEAQLLQQQIILAEVAVRKAEADLLETQAKIRLVEVEVLKANAELEITRAQVLKIPAEIELLKAQTKVADANALKVPEETAMVIQQRLTEVENTKVAIAQECKLRAEFELIQANVTKSGQESALLVQKVVTERAQTSPAGVDPDSVIGKQKALYGAQADGFKRDAEQKVAKIMVDSWSVRRTTDEGTIADGTNKLSDVHVGSAIQKMLNGVQA